MRKAQRKAHFNARLLFLHGANLISPKQERGQGPRTLAPQGKSELFVCRGLTERVIIVSVNRNFLHD